MQPDEEKKNADAVKNILNERLNVSSETPLEENKPADLEAVRTYSSDMADSIRREQESAVTIAAKEQAARTAKPSAPGTDSFSNLEKSPKNPRKFLIAGFIIILIVIGIIVFLYIKNNNSNSFSAPGTVPGTQVGAIVHTPIIPVNQTIPFDATNKTGADIIAALNTFETDPHPANTILELFPYTTDTKGNQTAIASTNLLPMLGLVAPISFTQAITPNVMLGVSYDGTTGTPFIIVQGQNSESLFAGLLAWESVLPVQATLLLQNDPNATAWTDTLIQNRDTRTTGSLLYSFLDQTTVAITTNQSAIDGLLARE